MNIGQAAAASGVSAKMIRYYERIGLIGPPPRTGSNYRVYGPEEIHLLRFIHRARNLGFSLAETGELLALWQDKSRASAEVKKIASAQIAALQAKIAGLNAMRDTLEHLLACCHGDERPDCPILNELSGTGSS